MTPETIEPILAAISGGAVTIAQEMAWRASTASILLLLISVLAWRFSRRTESEDAELIALLVMVICGVGSILCVVRAAFIYMTPHISAINYLSGVLK